MSLKTKKRIFWAAFFLSIIAFFSIFSGILTPFVAAVIITYLIYPIRKALVSKKVPKILATALTFSVMVVAVCLLVIVIFPIIKDQISTFIRRLPNYIDGISVFVADFMEQHFPDVEYDGNWKERFWAAINPHVKDFDRIIGTALSSGRALFNIFSILFLTPIVTFYTLHSWDGMVKSVSALFPRKSAAKIKSIIGEMNTAISGFIRGQSTVCCLFAAYYSGVLMFLNVDMALSIGSLTGLGLFIPYIGFAFGMFLALIVALQAGGILLVLKVLIAYMIGQIIESNFVTPNVVGDKTQLSPIAIIFALMAGGYLFGFVGVLLAVPVAAAIRILIKHGIASYKKSEIYLK